MLAYRPSRPERDDARAAAGSESRSQMHKFEHGGRVGLTRAGTVAEQ
jgi:hypothetical protein